MGLFDFLKKQTPVKTSSEKQQDVPAPLNPELKMPTLSNVNQDTITKAPLIETSAEQDGPPPLSILLSTATPSKQGLYPHEILMLEYAHHFKTSNNRFQNFWYWQYSVTDPQSILGSLLERGFLKVGDLRSALEKLKLSEIKEELKQLNQKVIGKKSELIDRLLEFGDLAALNQKYSERYYALTSKGEQELKENPYVSYLHRNRQMTVWEMNQRIAQTHYPYRDILWGYFNEQSGVHYQNFDFGLYRNTRLDMYQFLMEENKPKTAFHMLCEVLSFDLSGLSNGEKPLFEWEKSNPELYLMAYESKSEHFFPYEETTLIIPPAVTVWFSEMQATLGLSDKEYREALLKELQEVHPPRRIFTDEECADIVIADIHNDTNTLAAIYKEAEKREKARLKEIKAKLKDIPV